MKLVLLRHGIAAPLENHQTDAARPLTPEGIQKTRDAARGLKILVENCDFLASSPKIRALETAKIVAETWGKAAPKWEEWLELAQDEFEPLWEKLRVLKSQTAILVGHEPNLSHLAAQLLTGRAGGMTFDWKKAGACALEIDFKTGEVVLLWFMGPKTLRARE